VNPEWQRVLLGVDVETMGKTLSAEWSEFVSAGIFFVFIQAIC